MKRYFLLTSLLLLAAPAHAVDGFYAEYGRANASVVSYPAEAKLDRIGAMWNWNRSWLNDGDWHLTGYWDLSLAQWHGEKTGADNQTVTDLGIMPVFRYTPKDQSGPAPYLEAGLLGLHLISPTYLYAHRQFSTGFQFGNIVGFGIRLGGRRQLEIGYRFQHVSNGNIKMPNNGIDFNILHLAYWF